MSNLISFPIESWDSNSDYKIEQLLREYDETCMPLPPMESEPHLLISKVRKHYMEYLIKLLSVNYENNQKLVKKSIYLPSAIWRCAKNLELSAAKSCMVVQIYRKNILYLIKELKKDTKQAKLNKNLYDCLHIPPENEKKLQTNFTNFNECSCQCICSSRKKTKTLETPTRNLETGKQNDLLNSSNICNTNLMLTEETELTLKIKPSIRMSVESQESGDDLMTQLEKLFHEDPNDDDIFEGTLCNALDLNLSENDVIKPSTDINNPEVSKAQHVIDAHSAQIKSLDERLANLAGMLATSNEAPKPEIVKNKKSYSKWLCEEYFLKTKLFEIMDQIRDNNRKKHDRIKFLLLELFGEDSDDEGIVSPLEETSDFVSSCKERIAPWVIKLLTPYYVKGRIRGKALFKSLAKHLIRLIYQCSKYPEEYEVTSFVSDFLANHKMIRCEADFKEFRIKNI